MEAGEGDPITATRTCTVRAGSFTVKETWTPPGAQLPDHHHAASSIVVPLAGTFAQTDDAVDLVCAPGSMLIERSGWAHRNRYGPCGAHTIVVRLDMHAEPSAARLLQRPNARAMDLARAIRKAMRNPARELELECLCLELLGRAAHGPNWQPRPRLAMLRAALHYVWTEPAEVTSIAKLAALLGVSPLRLTRTFVRAYGVSLGAYVRRVRLALARDLIETTSDPISAIAFELGFADQSHLTNAFSARFGATPKAARNNRRPPPGR